MNTHFKYLLLSTILALPVTAPFCDAMEQLITQDAFQQKMNLGIHDYFRHLGELKAQELDIDIKNIVPNGAKIGKAKHEKYPNEKDLIKNSIPQKDQDERHRLVTEAYLKIPVSKDGTVDSLHIEAILSIGSHTPSIFKSLKIRGVISDEHMYKLIMLPGSFDCLRWWFMNQNCRGTPRSTSIVFLMVYDFPYGPCLGTTTWSPNIVPDGHKVNEIEGTAIGRALSHNINMEKVCLGGQEIGDIGAIEIAKALMVNKTLKTLLLNHNQIGDGGANEILKALAVNNTLEEIRLGGNRISDLVKAELLKLQIEGKRVIHI